MPDEELLKLYADYQWLAAIDPDPEFKVMRDACAEEVKWRNSQLVPERT
jgi:hypothetical protein